MSENTLHFVVKKDQTIQPDVKLMHEGYGDGDWFDVRKLKYNQGSLQIVTDRYQSGSSDYDLYTLTGRDEHKDNNSVFLEDGKEAVFKTCLDLKTEDNAVKKFIVLHVEPGTNEDRTVLMEYSDDIFKQSIAYLKQNKADAIASEEKRVMDTVDQMPKVGPLKRRPKPGK